MKFPFGTSAVPIEMYELSLFTSHLDACSNVIRITRVQVGERCHTIDSGARLKYSPRPPGRSGDMSRDMDKVQLPSFSFQLSPSGVPLQAFPME